MEHKADIGLSSVVADIGATNIRFARSRPEDGRLGPVVKFPTSNFQEFTGALEHFLNLDGGPRPDRLAIAVAGPVYDDEVKLTNSRLQFSIRQLKQDLNLKQLVVVNDLEALALVLPHVTSDDARPIGGPMVRRYMNAPMAVLCPGTGAGMAGLVPVDRGRRPGFPGPLHGPSRRRQRHSLRQPADQRIPVGGARDV